MARRIPREAMKLEGLFCGLSALTRRKSPREHPFLDDKNTVPDSISSFNPQAVTRGDHERSRVMIEGLIWHVWHDSLSNARVAHGQFIMIHDAVTR